MNRKRRDELADQYSKINHEGLKRLLAKAYKAGYDKGYDDSQNENDKMIKKFEKGLK